MTGCSDTPTGTSSIYRGFKRSELLFKYFGWQGGTIHQLAEETGVDTNTLLYGVPASPRSNFYAQGQLAAACVGPIGKAALAKAANGNVEFWLGVSNA